VGGVVATVHAAAGEVDQRVAAVDLALPGAEARAVPSHDAPRLRVRIWMTAEHDDFVAGAVERARQHGPDLTPPARNHQFHDLILVNMFTQNVNSRRRGRPSGRTAQGAAARDRLYETAMQLIAERGYEATTLRDIAKAANVSVGLLYRYFPSKQ